MIRDDGKLAITPALDFLLLYIKVIHLLGEAWCELLPGRFYAVGMQKSDIILNKMDSVLRELRYTFPGLSKQEEIHVLELSLLCCVGRHFRTGTYSPVTLKRISANISRIKTLSGEETSYMSNFIKQMRNICPPEGTNKSCIPLPVRNLVELFSLEQLQFSGSFRHIKAEFQVPGNDSENPVLFVSGLPVSITFEITLHDVSKDDRLWLQMIVGNSKQHAFLNLSQFEVSERSSFCTIQIPFYGSPNAASFVMKVLVVMECPDEYVAVNIKRGNVGPKYETVALCKMKDVYLVNTKC